MKTQKIFRVVLALSAVVVSSVGCSDDDDPKEKDGPRDECESQSIGCADPLLHYWLTPELSDGQYEITVETPDGTDVCTLTREGVNDVDVPIVSFDCGDADFAPDADLRADGLSFFNWQPETISLTIEDQGTGCSISLTDEPVYEATYDECSDTACIDAWSKWDISAFSACLSGMGGAGGGGS